MSGIEWLAITAGVFAVLGGASMAACILSFLVTYKRPARAAASGRFARGALLVAFVFACLAAACLVLLVGNLAIAALLTLAP